MRKHHIELGLAACALSALTLLVACSSDEGTSRVDCRQKESADSDSCAARGDLYTRKLDCDSSEQQDDALAAGCVEESPGSGGYDVCCGKNVKGVTGSGPSSGGASGAGSSTSSGGRASAGGNAGGGRPASGGASSGGGTPSAGGTLIGGGAGGFVAPGGGGGVAGGGSGGGGFAGGGAGGAAACTDPAFPTYCPATSEVEEGCWTGSTVCESITRCSDRNASCPVLGYVPDCSDPGCISKSQCNLPETDSCTACAEAKCCRRLAAAMDSPYCSVGRALGECVTTECNCNLPFLGGECVAD